MRRSAASLGCSIQSVTRHYQSTPRCRIINTRKAIHGSESGTVGIDGKNSSVAGSASGAGRAIKSVSRDSQSAVRIRAVVAGSEIMEIGETGTVGIDGKDRPRGVTSAGISCPIKRVLRQDENTPGIGTVGATREGLQIGIGLGLSIKTHDQAACGKECEGYE